MNTRFDRAAAEQRLGPAVVAAIRALVDEAPPLSIELRMSVRAVFESVPAPADSSSQPLAA